MAKMMKLRYYAAASVAAATAVVVKAFHDRPNFYSAAVQLSHSPISYGILLNLLLLSFGTLVYGIQLLLFGTLRLIERERLYERSWISITETLLIMMTFRDDISFHFLFLLSNLIVIRMWSWLNEGRIEMLEQQPPQNPRLFHARLSASLAMTVTLDILFLKHCVDTVLNDARPGMMVMYAFEFAVLGISCISGMLRYLLVLYEIRLVGKQTQALIEARRTQLQQELDTARSQAKDAGIDEEQAIRSMARPEDVDENEVEAAGWEAKGQWVFVLDISTDFLRLVVYLAFFTLLLLFHGLPIHILRDVYVTLHSFLKRIHSYIQYRNATKDMNAKFPDATVEELANENTCIVCREDMRVWSELDENGNQNDQRLRPKKLPCGHILHFNCLRSWLERQQVCPTCRRSVLASSQGPAYARHHVPGAQQQPEAQYPQAPRRDANGDVGRNDLPPNLPRPGPPAIAAAAPANVIDNAAVHPNGDDSATRDGQDGPHLRRRRQLIFTVPFFGHRIVLDWGHIDARTLQQYLQGQRDLPIGRTPQDAVQPVAPTAGSPTITPGVPSQADLIAYQRAISRELLLLNLTQAQLGHLRSMQEGLANLRRRVAQQHSETDAAARMALQFTQPTPLPASAPHTGPAGVPAGTSPGIAGASAAPQAGSLPPGMVLPEGWSIVPLNEPPGPANIHAAAHAAHVQASLRPPHGPSQQPTWPSHLAPFAQQLSHTPTWPPGIHNAQMRPGSTHAPSPALPQGSSRNFSDASAQSPLVANMIRDRSTPGPSQHGITTSSQDQQPQGDATTLTETWSSPDGATFEVRTTRTFQRSHGPGSNVPDNFGATPSNHNQVPTRAGDTHEQVNPGWSFNNVGSATPAPNTGDSATVDPRAQQLGESTISNGRAPTGANLTAQRPTTDSERGTARAVTIEDVPDEPVD